MVAQSEEVALEPDPWVRPNAVKRLRAFASPIGAPMATRPGPLFADDGTVTPPDEWDCPRCGFPAGRDKSSPPKPVKNEPYKTHLAYVKERRSATEGAAILEEALKKLRGEID